MKIRVIGCHGSVEPQYQTTCYWINDRFFIDAGSLSSTLTPKQQEKVTDIFVTHPHLDHIKDLAFLVENSATETRQPLNVHSTPDILSDIHKHIFNDVIWPDFSRIAVGADKTRFLLNFVPLGPDLTTEVGGVKVRAFTVNHPGHAVGYLLDDGTSQIVFSGDTGPCDRLWQVANQCPNLRAVYTEISFPSRLDQLARLSGHYTLEQLMQDLMHLQNKNVPIYISHFKPMFMNELLQEFHRKAPAQLKLMHESDEHLFS